MDPDGSARGERLRVVLDVTPLLGSPTGVYQVTEALIEALQQRGDVKLSGYAVSARAPGRRLGELSARMGLPVTRSRFPATACHLGWQRSDRPRLSRITRHADVVHGTNYTAPPGAPRRALGVARLRSSAASRADRAGFASPAAARRGVQPRLVTVHDFGMMTRPQWCTRAVVRMVPVLRRAVARGAHLHVTTRLNADLAVELLDADPSRVHRVPLGVRPLGPGDAGAARRLVGSERYVLALGTTAQRKDVHSLPRAVAPLDADIRLVVAGPPGSSEADLAEAVGRHGLSDRYVRLTAVDQRLRNGLIRGAAALAYPSLMEGFGLPPLEAVMVGTPVAATAVGVLPEMLEPGVALTAPGDRDTFACHLAALVDDPPTPDEGVRARISELTWELAAERLVAAYRAIRAGA